AFVGHDDFALFVASLVSEKFVEYRQSGDGFFAIRSFLERFAAFSDVAVDQRLPQVRVTNLPHVGKQRCTVLVIAHQPAKRLQRDLLYFGLGAHANLPTVAVVLCIPESATGDLDQASLRSNSRKEQEDKGLGDEN